MESSTSIRRLQRHNFDTASSSNLQVIFNDTLKELYFAKNAIDGLFRQIQSKIRSPNLESALRTHYRLNSNQKTRLEKVFTIQNITLEAKDCQLVTAILHHAEDHLKGCLHDLSNWEITLILTARKLAHYKIASYGAASHLAMSLNHTRAATLLALSVQEEEEFIQRFLDGVTHEYLSPR